MDKTNINLELVELAQLLLKKGKQFFLYRMPGEEHVNIAVENELSYHIENRGITKFIISPFKSAASNPEIELHKIKFSDENISAIAEYLNDLEDQKTDFGTLPEDLGKEDYMKKMDTFLHNIQTTEVEKAILSRVKKVAKPGSFHLFDFYGNLSAKYPETFSYLFYLPEIGLWCGASPELLLSKKGSTFKTMALAGTLPFSETKDYNWRGKEEEEHDLVRQHIESTFNKNNCSLIKSTGPYPFETGEVAHLRTDFEFAEGRETNLKNLIADLHPTPAIGGLPVKESLELINTFENYNRSYYTGYFGEMNGRESARLFINLRCMQIGKKEIALYVGGGITADSDPEEEWEETNYKSRTLLKVVEETAKTAWPEK